MQAESQSQAGLTPDEVNTLIRATVMAGMSVAASKSSGTLGTAAEFAAIARSFIEQIEAYASHPVLGALANDEARAEISRLVRQFNPETIKLQDIKPFAMRRCDELADILDAKCTPEEGATVKRAVLTVCQRVAEESREGGIFGIGGTRVSPEEEAVIHEVARALRIEA
ncbi:MAG: hypothetical protein KatS3mg053_1981 [Candidatus Roseilinea sp.]|nr:MAG: hypothetical protein KatS3mg053_1981 [Candidatus Roseilinea sp.]